MAIGFIWILTVPNGWLSPLKSNYKITPALSIILDAGAFDYSCLLNRLPNIHFSCSDYRKEKKNFIFIYIPPFQIIFFVLSISITLFPFYAIYRKAAELRICIITNSSALRLSGWLTNYSYLKLFYIY